MSRVLAPVAVMAVILACALFSAFDPRQAPGTIPSAHAAGAPMQVPTPPPLPSPSPVARPTAPPAAPLPWLATRAAIGAPALAAVEERPASPPPSTSASVSVRLADASDFVRQYRGYWCVGASLQMARAIITGKRDASRSSQGRLWRAAKARSPNSPYNGANPIGWTAMLNDLGLGPYRLVSRPDFEAAMRTATRALAKTNKPVGLVVWAGHHAWVMTGFEASGQPGLDGTQVTGVRVMDPLYPHKSKWGRAPAPDQLLPVEAVARQFVRRHRPDYDLGVPSGWLLIIPEA